MSAFIGGFAQGLKGYIDQNLEEKRSMEAEKRKIEMAKELEKWRIENTVAEQEFDAETGEVIYYSGSGKVLSRRPASPGQMAAAAESKKDKDMARRKTKADVTVAEFAADPKRLEDSFNLEQNSRRADIGYKGALSSEAGARTGLTNESLSRAKWENKILQGGGVPTTMAGRDRTGGGDDSPSMKMNEAAQRIRDVENDYRAQLASDDEGQKEIAQKVLQDIAKHRALMAQDPVAAWGLINMSISRHSGGAASNRQFSTPTTPAPLPNLR